VTEMLFAPTQQLHEGDADPASGDAQSGQGG
jgi:hypothetical protein